MKFFRIPSVKNEKLKMFLMDFCAVGKEGCLELLSIKYKGVDYAAIFNLAQRLRKSGYLEISKETNKKFFKLTPKGRNLTELIKFSFGYKKWDGKWRVLIFDIPEKTRGRRDFLRRRLKELGFKQLQQSVWITPWPLPESFTWLLKEVKIEKYMRALVVESVNREDELKELFDLK